MPKTPRNIEPFLPDGAVYNLSINERMRRLLFQAVGNLIDGRYDDTDKEDEAARLEQQYDDEVLQGMYEMLDPAAEDPLHPHPDINGFVL